MRCEIHPGLRKGSAGCAFAAAFLLSFPLSFSAEQKSAVELVFKNALVCDGTKLLTNTTVVVKGGLITDVRGAATASKDAQVIDARGKTLLPGFIDAHTHLVTGREALRAALAFGVTTELDMFSAQSVIADCRKALTGADRSSLADFRSAGTLVTAPGGHGTEYGLPIPTLSSPAEADTFVNARIAEGSDYIKIVYDDGKAFGINFPTLDKETLGAVIKAAKQKKKLAVVHIGSLQGARDAIEAGASGLAHLFADHAPDPEFGKFVADHHAFVVPTLTVLRSVAGSAAGAPLLQDTNIASLLSPAEQSGLRRAFPRMPGAAGKYEFAEEAVRQLKLAGVLLLVGTDAPNPGTTHGASLHEEMELLVRAGLTPAEALAAATSIPAKCFGLGDRGQIAAGKRADLILVEGNPVNDIRATRKIIGIWKEGVAFDRGSYLTEIERLRTEAARPAARGAGGLVSDFDEGKPSTTFGAGWHVSTDQLRGGKSMASFRVVDGGAENTKGSLQVEGEVAGDLPYAWAGAIFYPGSRPMEPADLSAKKKIRFWAKGDGRTYSVMLFASSRGFAPAIQTFVAEPDWKEFTFAIKSFEELDGHDLMGFFIGAGLPSGKFSFQLDTVRFE